MKIKDLPLKERPREKLLELGAQKMSDVELLAIFLRTGIGGKSVLDIIAHELIDNHGISHILSTMTLDDFLQTPGLGRTKYATVQAVIELSKRHYYSVAHSFEPLSHQECIDYLMSKLHHQQEEVFSALFLSDHNELIEYQELSVGSSIFVNAPKRELAKTALSNNAKRIILAHNHPQQNPQPSA